MMKASQDQDTNVMKIGRTPKAIRIGTNKRRRRSLKRITQPIQAFIMRYNKYYIQQFQTSTSTRKQHLRSIELVKVITRTFKCRKMPPITFMDADF